MLQLLPSNKEGGIELKKICLFLLTICISSNFIYFKANAESLSTTPMSNVIEAGSITPMSDVIGGGGGKGDFTFLDNGVVIYNDLTSKGVCTIYFPSATIDKYTNMAGFSGGIAGVLGATLKNTVAVGAVAVIGFNWVRIMNADNGNGATVLIDGSLTPRIASGCNYYMMY